MNADIIVIGGGVNGLTAAAVLADSGLRVVVVERNPWPGGLAASTPGLNSSLYAYALGLVPRELARMLGLRLEEVLHRPDPSWVELDESLEVVFQWWRSKERLAAEARDRGLDGLVDLLGLVDEFWKCFKGLGLYYTWEPPSRDEAVSRVDSCSRQAAVLLEESSASIMERYLPFWAWGLLLYPSMYRSNGFSLAYYLQNGNIWDLPVGGMGSVVSLLAREAERRGASLLYGVEARGLLFEGGRVSGVVLAGGRRVRARAVLYSGPVYSLTRLEGSERLGESELRLLRRLASRMLDVRRVDYLLRRSPRPPRMPEWRGHPILVYWTRGGGGDYSYPSLYSSMPVHLVQASGGIQDPLNPLPPGVSEDDIVLVWQRDRRSQEMCCFNATGHPDHVAMVDPFILDGRPIPGWGNYRTSIPGLYHGSASSYPGGEVNLVAGLNAALRILVDLGAGEKARSIARTLSDWGARG